MLRWLTAAVLLIFLGLVFLFALQNLTSTEVFFLTWQFSLPKAALIVVSYLLGMATGSALLGTILRSVRRLRAPVETQPPL
jgi:uncharacterized integral membrane protein